MARFLCDSGIIVKGVGYMSDERVNVWNSCKDTEKNGRRMSVQRIMINNGKMNFLAIYVE